MSSLTKTMFLVRPAKFMPCVLPRLFSSAAQFETLAVSVPKPHVYHVELNRPEKLNTFTHDSWRELKNCFSALSDNPECRVIVLSGKGKHFTAGIDLKSLMTIEMKTQDIEDPARKARIVYKFIEEYQDGITALEECIKPVIAVTHSACIGAGVDLITAADMRYCTEDSFFQVKEVDVGLAADVGTLQRLPKVIGSASVARDLCFTARKVPSKEALDIGLVSKVYSDRENAIKEVLEIAQSIALKSPIAVQTTKISMVYSQSRPTKEGLKHIRLLNQLMLQSDDLKAAAMAQLTKSQAEFENV
ncbi:delta(3,5)-Delta(2,4)-dienoyl-CoA isomerase, mitochondrial [Epargyreus clarus]|uniref:delta(3,5)-Delta(2,4)-dienoyl-CoA isomerase, mitochondrial n=1 Tax=Epargyreus clarus TaxID=520877 RepID=UPI003C2D1132